jgi:uncharacterized protein YecE (DUF72 family)
MKAACRVGTSSWSHDSWKGTVYPHDAVSRDYLGHYARRFDTVEVDATWYRIPSESMVRKWERDVPEGFVFAAKVPSVVTHEKMLTGAEGDLAAFLRVMDHLGPKLGPLLLQFPYAFKPDRIDDLDAFLKGLPKGYRFAVEVRHKGWLTERFYGMLRERDVALTLLDLLWMPRIDVTTAGWTYARFVGDRKGIEKKTKTWEQVIVDRAKEMEWWAPRLDAILERGLPIWAYFNNHYAGHAPGSVELFRRALERAGGTP